MRDQKRRKREWARKNRKPWNRLYDDPRWKSIRRQVLAVSPFCLGCGGKAEVVDHIRAHRGDLSLFLDPTNLQPLCRSCHNRKTAKEDSNFAKDSLKKRLSVCDDSGQPVDPDHPWNS